MVTRDQILLEIKRTAQSNGGKPLGRERFAKETGIRETDWAGRYWARWSEAVEAAGLTPNEYNRAFDSDFVLQYVAEETRRLGHVPTDRELRLRRRDNPEFPSASTIQTRGAKSALIRDVAEYCERSGGYEDVLQILLPQLSSDLADAKSDEPSGTREGFVYLLKSGKHYKVGRTDSLARREREIGLQLPEAAERVHVISTDDAAGIEHYWHRRFAEKRVNGEWFELSTVDVRAFKRRKYM